MPEICSSNEKLEFIEIRLSYGATNAKFLFLNIRQESWKLDSLYQLLQAVSVIGAHHVFRVAVLRAFRYSLGYSHKTWIFRVSRSSADAIGAIRAGHYAVGGLPNIHSCANSVINLA